ncbi:MAG: signal peptidase I [Pseudomonadota bacterium]
MNDATQIDEIKLSAGQRFWQEWRGFFLFLAIMIFFRMAIADWNHVPSGSMRPNLIEGDRIWVNKLAYDVKVPYTSIVLKKRSDPQRGDIVVFFSPDKNRTRMVKRLIGLPGDRVELRDNVLTINDEQVDYTGISLEETESTLLDLSLGFRHLEEGLPGKPHAMMVHSRRNVNRELRSFSATVPEGHYLMLGDNRDQSSDSRVWGVVPRNNIIGRSSTVVLSLRDAKGFFMPRGDRFFVSLQ